MTDEPRCPNCGEQKMIDVSGRKGYCNVCGKSFTLPKIGAPVRNT
jgi:hypothetical protein